MLAEVAEVAESTLNSRGGWLVVSILMRLSMLYLSLFLILYRNITNCTAAADNNNDDEYYSDLCVSGEFSHFMTRAMWAVYQAIIIILLINILIAMMNTTYNTIWSSSDTQWKYSKSFYQIQFLFPREALPSPFRVLYYLAKRLYLLRLSCRGASHTPEDTDQFEPFKRYRDKLREIVKGKVHADFQASIEDDFSDLRQDLQNFVAEKHDTSSKEINKKLTNLNDKVEEMMNTLKLILEQKK